MLDPEQRAFETVGRFSRRLLQDDYEEAKEAIRQAILADRADLRSAQTCGHPMACRAPTGASEDASVCSQCVREIKLESEHQAVGKLAGLRTAAALMCPACEGEFLSPNANKLDMAKGTHGTRGVACKAMPIRERMAKGG